ncbi:hypothetical protein PROFUN_15572 [Planoprotostelium fungivorum]|uniref:Uncharacterized protein n=1 Tax=Planoprotostelium fungivorum TaxID=1890364 RepID=A0A2P6MZ28_9EUKA|nr:hypothetical protein PROFUN_15572 [Planoprotostelium fungivorum]
MRTEADLKAENEMLRMRIEEFQIVLTAQRERAAHFLQQNLQTTHQLHTDLQNLQTQAKEVYKELHYDQRLRRSSSSVGEVMQPKKNIFAPNPMKALTSPHGSHDLYVIYEPIFTKAIEAFTLYDNNIPFLNTRIVNIIHIEINNFWVLPEDLTVAPSADIADILTDFVNTIIDVQCTPLNF